MESISSKEILEKHKITIITPCKNVETICKQLPRKRSVIYYGIIGRGRDKENSKIWPFIRSTYEPIKYLFEAINMKKEKPKYTIILTKTDLTLKSNHTLLKNIPKNIDYIYANNIDYKHKIIKHFPMGRDDRCRKYYNRFKTKEKPILCWCSFEVQRCGNSKRRIIYNHLKNKEWVKFNISDKTHKIKEKVDFEKYIKYLNKTKFMICPRGNGLETYRFYDSIYSGVIPIVINENVIYDKYKNLPILFLNDASDFEKITKEYLDEQYKILSKKFKTYHPILDINFWFKNMQKHINPDKWKY